MIELIIGLLLFPASAIIAGSIVWGTNRKKETDDSSLFWNFMVPFAISIIVLSGLSRTDTVRMKTDPIFKLNTELDAHPIYMAIKNFSPDEHTRLQKALSSSAEKGMTVPAMFQTLRPWLTQYGSKNMGWADSKTRIAWAQVSADTLSELQERNPKLCFQVIAELPGGNEALSQGLSSANTKAFEQAFVDLINSAHQGITNKRANNEPHVEFNEAGKQWRIIMDQVKERHGAAIAEIVSRKKINDTPPEMQNQVCPARIMQLSLMIEQPAPMASILVDSAMR